MKLVNQIKKLSFEKKRILAISLAVLLTILLIIINSIVGSVFGASDVGPIKSKHNAITNIQDSFSKIYNDAKPILDQAFSSTTKTEIMDQINKASSSVSTSSNIVQ